MPPEGVICKPIVAGLAMELAVGMTRTLKVGGGPARYHLRLLLTAGAAM